MNSKRTVLLALAMLVLIIPFGTVIATADSQNQQHQRQPLSLSLSGGVLNAGTQDYSLGGGKIVEAMINNVPLAPGSSVEYYMNARVSGSSVNGFFAMSIVGTDMKGNSLTVLSFGQIVSTPGAIQIPYGCTVDCTSEIPTFFLSGSQVSTWISGKETTAQQQITIESAYLNPFGGPILISSADGSIFVEATYTQATIEWRHVQMIGAVSTSDGKTIGGFAMNVNSHENLLTGIEYDGGTIALNILQGAFTGSFQGKSIVPTKGEMDCSTWFSLPSGTCMMTGLNSTGMMSLESGYFQMIGSYHTIWSIPAVGFTSTVHGALFHQHSDNPFGQNQDN